MTIEEIRAKHHEMRHAIRDIIQHFERETGAVVTYISLEHLMYESGKKFTATVGAEVYAVNQYGG